MRKSSSEILRNLEQRVARLERQTRIARLEKKSWGIAGYAEEATEVAKENINLYNRAGRKYNLKITEVKLHKYIKMEANGHEILLKVVTQFDNGDSFRMYKDGVEFRHAEIIYWGSHDDSDQELVEKFLEFYNRFIKWEVTL